MSISEIIEMKKIGDPNLSNLIEVHYLIYLFIDTYTAEVERNVLGGDGKQERDQIWGWEVYSQGGEYREAEGQNRLRAESFRGDEGQVTQEPLG